MINSQEFQSGGRGLKPHWGQIFFGPWGLLLHLRCRQNSGSNPLTSTPYGPILNILVFGHFNFKRKRKQTAVSWHLDRSGLKAWTFLLRLDVTQNSLSLKNIRVKNLLVIYSFGEGSRNGGAEHGTSDAQQRRRFNFVWFLSVLVHFTLLKTFCSRNNLNLLPANSSNCTISPSHSSPRASPPSPPTPTHS